MVGAAFVVSFTLASCERAPTSVSFHPVHVSSGASNVKEAIATGWKAALSADDNAERDSEWWSPALAATHSEPQLNRLRTNLYAAYLNHWVAVGHDIVRSVRVTRVWGDLASVVACIEGNEIDVSTLTGRPAPGVFGEAGPAQFNATMLRTPTGWKIENQTAREGEC